MFSSFKITYTTSRTTNCDHANSNGIGEIRHTILIHGSTFCSSLSCCNYIFKQRNPPGFLFLCLFACISSLMNIAFIFVPWITRPTAFFYDTCSYTNTRNNLQRDLIKYSAQLTTKENFRLKFVYFSRYLTRLYTYGQTN